MKPRNRYYLSIPELALAHGEDPRLAWDGASPADLAAALEEALRSPLLFQRWQAQQADPEAVDPALGATDQLAQVHASVADLQVDMEVTTDLPMGLLRQRLNWLIGAHWQLRDVRPA